MSEKKITSADHARIFVLLPLFMFHIFVSDWCSSSKNQKCPKSTTSDVRRPPGEKCRKWWNYRLIRSLQEATFYTHNIIGNWGFHFTSYSSHFVTSTSRHIHWIFYLSILFKLNIPLICPKTSRDENIVVRNTSVWRCWLVEEWNTTAAGVETALGPAVAGTADTGMLPPS